MLPNLLDALSGVEIRIVALGFFILAIWFTWSGSTEQATHAFMFAMAALHVQKLKPNAPELPPPPLVEEKHA